MAETAPDSVQLFTTVNVAPDGSITFPTFVAPLTLDFGSLAGPSVLTFTQSAAGGNRGLIDFAPGLAGRQADAGKMGYEAFTTGYFDIVGAGAAIPRAVRIWDTLKVGGGALSNAVDGGITASGTSAQYAFMDRSNSAKQGILYCDLVTRLFHTDWGDIGLFTARTGDLADLWCEYASTPVAGATMRARVNLSNFARGFLSANLYNDAGGWHLENAGVNGFMSYVDTSGVHVYGIATGIGTLGQISIWPNGAFNQDVLGPIHATVFTVSSDQRLKKNIQTIKGALDSLTQLRGVTFNWNEKQERMGRARGGELAGTHFGVIAQEVAEVFPDAVTEWQHPPNEGDERDETVYLGVEYDRLIPVLIEATKELSDRVKELERKEGVNG